MVSSPATWDGKKMLFFKASVKRILRLTIPPLLLEALLTLAARS